MSFCFLISKSQVKQVGKILESVWGREHYVTGSLLVTHVVILNGNLFYFILRSALFPSKRGLKLITIFENQVGLQLNFFNY